MIPGEGCIIGRTETGAEELAPFPSVSRRHLKCTPRRELGVILEDISKYGTLLDGERLGKNTPVRARAGARINMCGAEAELVLRGDYGTG